MITFLICLIALVAAYFLYGAYLDRVCQIDEKATVPSAALYDGVDYIPMPRWRTFLIQLLNIAGVGPIFGAIMGACFGPVAFLWITLGGIFVGAMHDYVSGVILLRNDGLSLPEIVGRYLGSGMLQLMRVISMVLLILVGVVFMRSPASIMMEMVPAVSYWWWIAIILFYYFIATMLPIDKLIGKVYPLFGAALIIMALGLLAVLLFGEYTIPDLTFATLRNFQPNAEAMPIVPTLFITIACGAISGFHATQSPLMARCMNNERESRVVFYGAMIAEGIVAMIWATAAIAYCGGPEGLNNAMTDVGTEINGQIIRNAQAADLVDLICRSWLGKVGAVIAILGVVICPITSGDTAFRSLRLSIADMFSYDQKPIAKRLIVCLPIFAVAFLFCKVDFSTAWSYLGIANQTLATLVMWTGAAYLIAKGKPHWMCSVPAAFLTFVCVSFILTAPIGFQLSPTVGYAVGIPVAIGLFVFCVLKGSKRGLSSL